MDNTDVQNKDALWTAKNCQTMQHLCHFLITHHFSLSTLHFPKIPIFIPADGSKKDVPILTQFKYDNKQFRAIWNV